MGAKPPGIVAKLQLFITHRFRKCNPLRSAYRVQRHRQRQVSNPPIQLAFICDSITISYVSGTLLIVFNNAFCALSRCNRWRRHSQLSGCRAVSVKGNRTSFNSYISHAASTAIYPMRPTKLSLSVLSVTIFCCSMPLTITWCRVSSASA